MLLAHAFDGDLTVRNLRLEQPFGVVPRLSADLVIDNLEKGLAHAEGRDALDALKEGVRLTLKGLKDVLMKEGLEEVKAEGAPFDPNYHEALMQKEDDSVPPGTVIQACQAGYILNDRLVRPALVVVSKGKDAENQ